MVYSWKKICTGYYNKRAKDINKKVFGFLYGMNKERLFVERWCWHAAAYINVMEKRETDMAWYIGLGLYQHYNAAFVGLQRSGFSWRAS